MLEQKDYLNVEIRFRDSLKQIKNQLKSNKITKATSIQKAKDDLFNLKHRFRILELMLPLEEIEKIKTLMNEYENFIEINTQQIEVNNV